MKEHKDGKIENSQTEPIAKQGPEQVSAKKPYENPKSFIARHWRRWLECAARPQVKL